jgi:hypothetical protein
MKAKRQDLLDCMLSIYDTLKLHDNGSLLEDETLSEIMFRKMKSHNIDLNKELGFTHLKPVEKIQQFCERLGITEQDLINVYKDNLMKIVETAEESKNWTYQDMRMAYTLGRDDARHSIFQGTYIDTFKEWLNLK